VNDLAQQAEDLARQEREESWPVIWAMGVVGIVGSLLWLLFAVVFLGGVAAWAAAGSAWEGVRRRRS